MATMDRRHRNQTMMMIGLALTLGIAGASMACQADGGVAERQEAESEVRVIGDAPQEPETRAEYVFVDVGAWDDTHVEWNISRALAEPRRADFVDLEQELGHGYSDAVIPGQVTGANKPELFRVGNWYEDEFAAMN